MPDSSDEVVRDITIHGSGDHDNRELISSRRSYVTRRSDEPQRVTYTISYPEDVGQDILKAGALPDPIVDGIQEVMVAPEADQN